MTTSPAAGVVGTLAAWGRRTEYPVRWQSSAEIEVKCAAGPDPADHQPFHDGVLVPLDTSAPGTRCDAVVVPTSRDGTLLRSGLRLAARLAAAQGCPLVVLVSAQAASASGREWIAASVRRCTDGAVRPWIVDVTALDPHTLGLSTDRTALATSSWLGWKGPGDTALKRNLALLLARRHRWSSVLFVDDDIRVEMPRQEPGGRGLDAATLELAAGALRARRHRAVGWAALGYRDNSVVCRVRHVLGFPQGVFVGAGALLVRVDDAVPFFPRIYNEDWLFLIAMLMAGARGAVACAGRVLQDPPECDVTPQRAAMEERGDLVAEVLMNLAAVPDGVVTLGREKDFWSRATQRRVQLVHDLRPLLEEFVRPDDVADVLGRALEALAATQRVHGEITSSGDAWLRDVCDYVGSWLDDRDTWRRLLRQAAAGCLPDAVERKVPRPSDASAI